MVIVVIAAIPRSQVLWKSDPQPQAQVYQKKRGHCGEHVLNCLIAAKIGRRGINTRPEARQASAVTADR